MKLAMAFLIVLLAISGCSQAPQQPTPQQEAPESPQTTEIVTPPAEEPQQQTQQQPATEDEEIYKDSLDESLDELSQLE